MIAGPDHPDRGGAGSAVVTEQVAAYGPADVERLLADAAIVRNRRKIDATIANAWAGLYDMTPDAHPIVGRVADGVYAACGFSGHGFMQSPAVGRALAELIVRGEPSIDLSPYALERFESGAVFPERLVL